MFSKISYKQYLLSILQSFFSILIIAIPTIVLGLNKYSLSFSTSLRAAFILENIFNSKISFKGDIKNTLNKLSVNLKSLLLLFFLILISLTQLLFFVFKGDIYEINFDFPFLNNRNFLFILTVICLIITSFLRLLTSRQMLAYNFQRFNSKNEIINVYDSLIICDYIVILFIVFGLKNFIAPILIIPILFGYFYYVMKRIGNNLQNLILKNNRFL